MFILCLIVFLSHPLLVLFLPQIKAYIHKSASVFLPVALFCLELVTWPQTKIKVFFLLVTFVVATAAVVSVCGDLPSKRKFINSV